MYLTYYTHKITYSHGLINFLYMFFKVFTLACSVLCHKYFNLFMFMKYIIYICKVFFIAYVMKTLCRYTLKREKTY